MSVSVPSFLKRRDLYRLAAVLRTSVAVAEDGERLSFTQLHISDPAAVLADLNTLEALDLPELEVRQWIVWNTDSVDGTLEVGLPLGVSFASVRRHCESLITAAADRK